MRRGVLLRLLLRSKQHVRHRQFDDMGTLSYWMVDMSDNDSASLRRLSTANVSQRRESQSGEQVTDKIYFILLLLPLRMFWVTRGDLFFVAELANVGNNLQVMSLFIQTHDWGAISEQNHGRRLGVGIPELSDLWVVLHLDGDQSTSVRQKGLGSKNIILDVSLRLSVIEIDQNRLFFRELGQDFVHCVVLGIECR